MTDHELLELAAKIANENGTFIEPGGLCGQPSLWGILSFPNPLQFSVWNPLVDDGQAMRLAVELGMDIMFSEPTYPTEVSIHYKDVDGNEVEATESLGADAHAAVRRAIVRAAVKVELATR